MAACGLTLRAGFNARRNLGPCPCRRDDCRDRDQGSDDTHGLILRRCWIIRFYGVDRNFASRKTWTPCARFRVRAVGLGGSGRGDNGSPVAPRCSRADRAASTRGEAACDSSHPGRRTEGNNDEATSVAGHRRRGAIHRRDALAGADAEGVAHNTLDLQPVPGRWRSG